MAKKVNLSRVPNTQTKTVVLFSKETFQSGLTWRSLLAVIYGICVFSPAFIWLSLVTVGAPLIRSVSFMTLILCIELARLSGTSLTKQEGFIIFSLCRRGVHDVS